MALRARETGFFDHDELRAAVARSSPTSRSRSSCSTSRTASSYLALYDPLTGLPNRTLFHERLTQALEGARRGSETLALALIDLERFKAINDTLGQEAGDRVLQAARAAPAATRRATSTAWRAWAATCSR